jgi:hypothetical protein
MSVVDFKQFKEDKEPHSRGPARCLDCKHEWEAIAHQDAVWLECPKCSLNKGRFLGAFSLGKFKWFCNCENDLFHITPDGSYCPNCGSWCKFP